MCGDEGRIKCFNARRNLNATDNFLAAERRHRVARGENPWFQLVFLLSLSPGRGGINRCRPCGDLVLATTSVPGTCLIEECKFPSRDDAKSGHRFFDGTARTPAFGC